MSDAVHAFRDMADRIEALKDGEFGGAILVVPPVDHSGVTTEELAQLFSGPKPDVAFFWSSAKSLVEIAQVEFERRFRERDTPFGMR